MSSIFDINMSNKSNFNLSFLVDVGETKWYNGEEKQSNDFLNKDFKNQIPKSQIFEMNSLIFNITKHKNEVYSTVFERFDYEEYINIELNYTKEDLKKKYLVRIIADRT